MRVWAVGVAAAALVLTGCGSEAEPGPVPSSSTAPPSTTTTAAPVPTSEEALPPPPPVDSSVPLEPPPTAEPQTTYAAIGGAYYFSSPDGSFQCGIVPLANRTEAGCQGVTTPIPPRPDDCMINWGNGIRVTNDGPAAFMCSGGVVYTSGGATVDPPLTIGSEIAEGGFTCTSAADGISCKNDASGHGFRIAADSNEVF